jgi:hypothetical protein
MAWHHDLSLNLLSPQSTHESLKLGGEREFLTINTGQSPKNILIHIIQRAEKYRRGAERTELLYS